MAEEEKNWLSFPARTRLFESSQEKFRNHIKVAGDSLAAAMIECRNIYSAFDGLPKGKTLGGFDSFNSWALAAAEEMGMRHRSIHYYRLCGERLIGQCGLLPEDLQQIGVEKCKALAGYVRDKGGAPSEEIMRMARDPEVKVQDFRTEVSNAVWHESGDHRGGRMEFLEISGPAEWIKNLKVLMETGRLQYGDISSDAELICALIGPAIREMVNEEAEARSRISGIPVGEQVIDREGKEITDGEYKDAGDGREPSPEGL